MTWTVRSGTRCRSHGRELRPGALSLVDRIAASVTTRSPKEPPGMPEPRRSSEKNKRAAECRVHQPTPPMPAGDVAKTLEGQEQRQLRSTGHAHRRVASTSPGGSASRGAPPIARATRPQRQRGRAKHPRRECALCPPLEIKGVAHDPLAGRWGPVDDLCAIIGFLLPMAHTSSEEGVLAWLRSRHPELAQRRPLDALGAGDFVCVRSRRADPRSRRI